MVWLSGQAASQYCETKPRADSEQAAKVTGWQQHPEKQFFTKNIFFHWDTLLHRRH